MELKIIIDINLTQEELHFLRKYFDNKEGVLDLFEMDSERNCAIGLVEKDILKIGGVSYSLSLTNIGKKVMDLIDRDKRINEILN